MDWLLVTEDDSGTRPKKADRFCKIVLVCTKHAVWAGGETGTIIAGLYFLADVPVDISPAILSRALVERSVPQNARRQSDASIIVVVILHLEIWLDVTEVARSRATAEMICRKIHTYFSLVTSAND